ncbi:hypothetical protein BK127_42330 [Paenibacillus sp. FSL H7-0331]|nr:hypothetical protein BK127_42330 [Paenibacillus sp. FSL H7-0331]
MFNLQWFSAGDDLACKHEPYVFRLHKNLVTLKEDHRSQFKQEIKAYDLQYRKTEIALKLRKYLQVESCRTHLIGRNRSI